VSPPGEFCTSRFGISPELHTFPLAAVGKAVNLRATVQLLPRVPEIPRPLCHERHDVDAASDSAGGASKSAQRQKSPELVDERGRSSSPRFTKPNVLSHMMPSEYLSATTRCSVQECSVGLMQMNKSEVNNHLSCATVTCEPADVGGRLSSSAVMAKCPSVASKDLGAIPKRFELPLYSSAILSPSEVCCDVAFCEPLVSVTDRIVQCKAVTTTPAVPPQVLALQKSSPKAVFCTPRRHSMLPKDGTDSESSSPDIDAYLSNTLASSRLEPLSPQEMDVYLSSMYPQRMHKFKSVSSSFKVKSPEAANHSSSRYVKAAMQVGRSELDGPCSDSSLGDVLKSIGYRTPPSHRRSSSSSSSGIGSGQMDDSERFDSLVTDVSSNCSISADDDCVFESSHPSDLTPSNHAICGPSGNTNRQLVYSKHDAVHPKFLVGDEQAEELKTSMESASVTEESANQSPVLLHKSVSCPNKKALGAGTVALNKANSLLRTVMMKKELQAATVTEVQIRHYATVIY